MTGSPLSRANLKRQNAQTRKEQVQAEREDARQRELDRTATLRAKRLAKEQAEKEVDLDVADDKGAAEADDTGWPWCFPQPHRF